MTPTPAKTPSSPICADGGVGITVWEDINGNGLQESNEKPLSDTCVWVQLSDNFPDTDTVNKVCDSGKNHTDKDGRWSSGFLWGGCGPMEEVAAKIEIECKKYYAFVHVPIGYQVTTVNPSNNCGLNKFGLNRIATPTP